MRLKIIGAVLAVCGSAALAAPAAQAKGCIRGAVAGGVAGHMVHHTVTGAVAGCLTARHFYKQKERQQQVQPAPSGPPRAPQSTQPLEKSGYR